MRALVTTTLTAAITATTVACAPNDRPIQTPPVTIVNTPTSDSGQTVLLTVVVLLLTATTTAVAVLVMAWLSERCLRKQAQETAARLEDALVALTGQPVGWSRYTTRPLSAVAPVVDTRPAIRSSAGGP